MRHLCLIDVIRFLATMSVNKLSVRSEFDIFASVHVLTSVLETTEVKYKNIATVDHSDPLFLIPDIMTHT